MSTYNPLLPAPAKLGPQRATLRRLASALAELLTPCVPDLGTDLVSAYRTTTAPASAIQLLDYIEELLDERDAARAFYTDNVQALLVAWKADRNCGTESPFFNLKCRELTGLALDETTAPVALPAEWPAAQEAAVFSGA